MITEHYQQENPEGARLVSDDKPAQPEGAARPKPRRSKTAAKQSSTKKAPAAPRKKTGDSSSDTRQDQEISQKRASSADIGKVGDKPAKAETNKPKPAKKGGAAAKKQPSSHEEAATVKTPSVMKLVENATLAENQVIAAGKSRIPRQLRGIEPLSRVIRREAEAESAAEAVQSSPMVRKNLTGMIIEAEAPAILTRFNACDCERCRSELIRLTEAEMPARYITMPELADISYTGFSDDEKLLIESVKKTVVSLMIRLMIGNKKRSFHNK